MQQAFLSIVQEEVRKEIEEHGYIYVKPMNHGAFSTIHLATSSRYQQEFVVKVSLHHGDISPERDAEISTLKTLNHPNIITFYDYWFGPKYLYIVLDYCPGGSLQEILQRDGVIKPPLLKRYAGEILKALSFCHSRRIAHLDIKPGNVLIDKYGRCKLADFGMGKFVPQGMRLGVHCGSRSFMAPEMFKRSGVDPLKADVWSFGIMLYYMALGKLPWRCLRDARLELEIREGIQDVNELMEVDSAIWSVVRKATALDPKDRVTMQWIVKHGMLLPEEGEGARTEKRHVGLYHVDSVMNLKLIAGNGAVSTPVCNPETAHPIGKPKSFLSSLSLHNLLHPSTKPIPARKSMGVIRIVPSGTIEQPGNVTPADKDKSIRNIQWSPSLPGISDLPHENAE